MTQKLREPHMHVYVWGEVEEEGGGCARVHVCVCMCAPEQMCMSMRTRSGLLGPRVKELQSHVSHYIPIPTLWFARGAEGRAEAAEGGVGRLMDDAGAVAGGAAH